jgi:hypothetical protein
LWLCLRVLGKPREPISHKLEPAAIEPVDASAPVPIVMYQSSRLQHLDVPGRRRPGMLEHSGNVTSRHRSALEVQRHQDPSAHWMGERREHSLVRIQPCFPFLPRHARYI